MTEAERAANRKKNKPMLDAFEAASIKEYGFFIHFVAKDSSSPTLFNTHTHGLERSFKHLDLQIVCPVPEQLAMYVFHTVVDFIKKGKSFADGEISYDVLDLPVKFVAAKECDRDVLRIILPDTKGLVDRTMAFPFNKQYLDLITISTTPSNN